ncbi:MAG: hypothetical protein AAFN93_00400 [Bacteroidota bacterium]
MKTKVFSLMIIVFFSGSVNMIIAQDFSKKLKKYTDEVVIEFNQIANDRQIELKEIAQEGQVGIIIICTHNSRRNHISLVSLQTAALYYGIDGMQTFSGGLEETACHPNAVVAFYVF